MLRFRFAVLMALAVTAITAAPAVAQTACDPTQTPPEFRGQVPKLSEVVPTPGGENGEVTTDQAYAYMDAVDAASERVITGALEQTSQEGRELRWAIVGHAGSPRPRSAARHQACCPEAARPPHVAGACAADRPPLPGHPVGGLERPRRGGVRHGRLHARPLRARRPRRLRRAPDPRQLARRAAPDSEPGRPRGGHAPQLLRLRHEPRLVRAHAAGDRRQDRVPA